MDNESSPQYSCLDILSKSVAENVLKGVKIEMLMYEGLFTKLFETANDILFLFIISEFDSYV